MEIHYGFLLHFCNMILRFAVRYGNSRSLAFCLLAILTLLSGAASLQAASVPSGCWSGDSGSPAASWDGP